jgi:hypothetical protein
MSGAMIGQHVAEDVMVDAITEEPIDGANSGLGLALIALSSSVSLGVIYWLTKALMTTTPFGY